MKKIVITGASGLLGRHATIRLYAHNCAEKFAGRQQPYMIESLTHKDFEKHKRLIDAVDKSDIVLHFAGVNRGPNDEVEKANPAIAETLIAACRATGSIPHIVYANSTHCTSDTPYGRSKKIAHEILGNFTDKYTNLILPHIFGEGARPHYNNVTATFIDQVIKEQEPQVNAEGGVELLHAGLVAESALKFALNGKTGDMRLTGRTMSVKELLSIIKHFHKCYSNNIYPDLNDPFTVALFNTYRTKLYPDKFPRNLIRHSDERGCLFEAVKGGSAGQTFLSWTEPQVTRGNHFHINKIERFLVLEGDAVIRIRPVLENQVWEYRVTGDQPSIIDMPTLHTHSIQNISNRPLLTLFWTNEVFNPDNPDTFADIVLKG